MSVHLYLPETVDLICRWLSKGNTRTAAAGAAKISRETFYNWMKTHPGFSELVAEAEAKGEEMLVEIAARNPRSAMQLLERRFRDDWSPPTQRVQIQNDIHITVALAGADGADLLVEGEVPELPAPD